MLMNLWSNFVWTVINIVGILGLIIILMMIAKAVDMGLCRIWDYFEERRA